MAHATVALRKAVPKSDLIPLERVRTRLAAIWLGASCLIFLIMVVQSLVAVYQADTQDFTKEAWGWLLPTIMPTLAIIISVLGYSALDPLFSASAVRRSFFRLALYLSAFYLALVLLTLLIQPFSAKSPASAIGLMHTSNLWLGPLQGLVASALGVLFVSKQPKGSAEEGE